MTSYMDQKWKDLVQMKLDKATSVKQMDEIMAAEMDVIWPKYRKRKLLFQSKQDKESDLEYIAEIRGKAELSELRELIPKDKKCRHCKADDPLTLEDIEIYCHT